MRVKYFILAVLAVSLFGSAPHSGSTTCPSSGNLAILSISVSTPTYTLLAPGSTDAVPNTGIVYFGGPAVTTSGANVGFPLIPGSSYTAPTQGNAGPYNLHNVYIACSVNTDTIRYTYQ
jgi:hypothetical protein